MIKKYCIAILLAIAVLCISTHTTLAATPQIITVDEQTKALNNWRTTLLGTQIDEKDAVLMSVLKDRDNNVSAIMSKLSTNIKEKPVGSGVRYVFSDLSNWPTSSKSILETASRVELMATQYNTYGSTYYQDAVLKQQIIDALEVINVDMYNEQTATYADVNDWNIFIPKTLINSIVLMNSDLPIALTQNYLKAFDHFEPKVATDLSIGTGSNRINKGFIIVLRGVIGLDQDKINLGAKIMEHGYKTVIPGTGPGSGFYADGSFIQHDKTPYTSGYGVDILKASAGLLQLFNGTSLLSNAASANNFQIFQNSIYTYLDKNYLPVLYKNEVLDMTRGRGITSNAQSNEDVANTMLYNMYIISQKKAALKEPYSNIIKSAIYDSSLRSDFYKNMTIPQAQTFQSLLADTTISKTYSDDKKNTMMSWARQMIDRNKDYVAGLSMFSKNISAFEFIGSQNKTGFYTGTGALSLYNGDESLRGDYYPTVNMAMLPGTTTDMKLPALTAAENNKLFSNTESWSGGISDGINGSATLDYSMANVTASSLSAKKSWFFLDDIIVAMGTGITSTEGLNTQTIVENRQLLNPSNTFSVNGQEIPLAQNTTKQVTNVSWAHLAGTTSNQDIGYIFPQFTNVNAFKQTQFGNWDTLDSGNDLKAVSATYAGLTIPHGANPTDASYMYMILPGSSKEDTEKKASDSGVLTTNTGNVQGVLDKERDLAIMNYRAPGEAGYATVTKHNYNSTAYTSGSIMIRYATDQERKIKKITLSDPSMEAKSIHFSVPKESYAVVSSQPGKGTVKSEGDTWDITVDTSGKTGESFQFVFENEPPTLTADDFTMGDSYVTGNYTGDVAKIGLKVNGTLLQLINATTSPYQYYAKGKIIAITDTVSFITYDANGNLLKEVPVNVKGASTLKANDFTIGDSYVTGTYTGAVARVALKVNGTLLPEINVSGSSYQYNAKDKIKAATDTVSLISYDARGIQLKEVPVTVKAVPITIATDDFTVGVDSYVTGTYTGDLSRIALEVDGVAQTKIPVSDSSYRYYTYQLIKTTTSEVNIIGYDSSGAEITRSKVTLNSKPQITANTFTTGKDNYITGSYTGVVDKIALEVNGTVLQKINVTGSPYQYYAKSNNLKASDTVYIVCYVASGVEANRVRVILK
ncbi:hypothetical protein HB911_06495 [Listeria booriae]|uniref:immunoglobulin-like domain-containing protein n=1 Tax=Listeria booriae TaxID=1552123 RepID=UPI0016243651|nr:immunoglobulin-like domain-containing protein [Listeria booriae]MBC1558338.1 hypothetical protein [Listeria booriae]